MSNAICKITWGKGILKIINLRHVTSVYQHKNRLTITYNTTSSDGLLIFGSGFVNQEPHKESIIFDNENDATVQMNEFYNNLKSLDLK
jgi:hypothetical protein